MDGGLVGRVREVVARSGMGQNEFSRAVGLDPSKLSKSLSGVRRFTSLELALIAERGRVTVDWLLTGVGEAPAAVAARAGQLRPDSVAAAADRAEHLEDLWLSLVDLGTVSPVRPAPPPGRPRRGRMIDQGRKLADVAWSTVTEHGLAHRVIDDLPIVIESAFGVHVAVERLGDGLDGFSYRRDGFLLALVSADSSWTRRRFTIAHELGHLLAGDGEGLRVDTDVMAPQVRADRIEMRANAFAAAFLMPEDRLRDQVGADLTDHDFARLVGVLRVSPSALAWRLKSLGLIDDGRRAALAAMGLRAAALRGGWSDELRVLDAERGATRPCMVLVRAALLAYERGDASVRPLASILGREPEEVLAALQPEDAGALESLEPGEPVFAP